MKSDSQNNTTDEEVEKIRPKNLSVISSIYQSKAFTKYAVYSLIGYCVTRNPKMGLLALNCNSSAVVVFNYIRFFNPALYAIYKNKIKKQYEISEIKFQLGDIMFHVVPLSMSIYSRRYWYNKVSYRSTCLVSIASYLYQLAWAYYYSNGIDVSKAYDIPPNTITNNQCKRLWFLIFLCHNLTTIQKTVRRLT